MKDIREPEDSLFIEAKLQRWETAEKVLRWGYILGIVASLAVLVLVLLEEVTFSWFVFILAAGVPVLAAWTLTKFQLDKLDDRLHHAEFLERFYAISRKYQERMLNVKNKTEVKPTV